MTPSKLDDTARSSATGHGGGALNWHLSLSYLVEHMRLGTHCRPLLGQAPSPAISPRSRAARHTDKWELYNPSRRRKAPISPGPEVSTSLSTVRLYSALNRRRAAFSATSTSGITTAAVRFSIHALPCSALYIKLWGEQCLTHVGREGPAPNSRDRQGQFSTQGVVDRAAGWIVLLDQSRCVIHESDLMSRIGSDASARADIRVGVNGRMASQGLCNRLDRLGPASAVEDSIRTVATIKNGLCKDQRQELAQCGDRRESLGGSRR